MLVREFQIGRRVGEGHGRAISIHIAAEQNGLLRVVATELEKKAELATGVEQSLRQRDPRVPEWVVAAL